MGDMLGFERPIIKTIGGGIHEIRSSACNRVIDRHGLWAALRNNPYQLPAAFGHCFCGYASKNCPPLGSGAGLVLGWKVWL